MGIEKRERKGTVYRQYSRGWPEAGRGPSVSRGSREDREHRYTQCMYVCVCVEGGGGGGQKVGTTGGRISEEGGRVDAKRAQGEVKERRG